MHFLLEGAVYPFTHTTQRHKWRKEGPYREKYLPSKNNLEWQIKQQMSASGWQMLEKRSLRLAVLFVVSSPPHKCDLSNQLKAVEDALQGLAFANDAWVDVVFASRVRGEPDMTWIEIALVDEIADSQVAALYPPWFRVNVD